MAEPPPPHVTNERYKSFSRALFQLGTALLAADAVKVYDDLTISLEAASWLIVSAVLIWTGWLVLSLLERES